MVSKVKFRVQEDDQLKRFLAGTVGICDATGYEELALWRELHQEQKKTWVQHGGYLITVGHYHKRPVCLSMMPVDVDGHKIMFIEATSQMVDHAMIDAWLEYHMPETCFNDRGNGKYLNRANAMNFHNVLPR